jgi:cell division protease FtsH
MHALNRIFESLRNGVIAFFAPKKKGLALSEEIPNQHFSDVAALGEAVDALRALVDVLKCPEKYARYGARAPRGVLLYGPPGTGKTLMARALAGEAGVPFFNVCGSDFVQMYVGVGASRVRELFRTARKRGRAVIFIDEIDALGARREGGNEEREQTLNALLTEMSGFRGDEGIIVLAATNRPDKLDTALTRPGRFDKQIEVGMPDRAGRLRILSVHAQGKPIARDVSLERLAADTVSFSGAKLESLVNEAALRAARRDDGLITSDDLDIAMRAVLVGDEKLSRSDNLRERELTAFHEAGHAVATLLLEPESRLARVSIIPSTRGAAGYSMAVPPDRMLLTHAQIEAHIGIALAGRAAEEVVFGAASITTGAANDLAKATELTARMCLEWGMDDEAGLAVRQMLTPFGATGGEAIVRARLHRTYQMTKALLDENRDALCAVAQGLLEQEWLDGDAVRNLAQIA